MRERRFFDRAGKLNALLKTAISDFHLLIAESFFEEGVAPATANPQAGLGDLELELVGANARKIHLYYPALGRAINVGRRVPQAPRRSNAMGDG